jgi:hypothetical protein
MSLSLSFRLSLAILLLAATQLGVAYIRGGGTPERVRMPDFDIHDLPLELGRWRGEEREISTRLLGAIGAEAALSRIYYDRQEHPVSLHSAVFLEYDLYGPHPPAACYLLSGYEIIGTRPAPFQTDAGQVVHAHLMTVARDGVESYVLFWYQLGPFTFGSGWAGHERRAFWGQRDWPPMLKVMLHDAGHDPPAAEARMAELGKEVYQWMNPPKSTKPGQRSGE